MHKTKTFPLIVLSLLAILLISIAVFSLILPRCYFVGQAAYEIVLPAPKAKTLIMDVSKEDYLGRYVISKIKINTKSKGIVNQGNTPLRIKVHTSGFPAPTELISSSSGFNTKTGMLKNPLVPGQSLMMDVKTTIPKEWQNKAQICNGYIHFINQETGMELSAVHVKIYNSYLMRKYGANISKKKTQLLRINIKKNKKE